MHKTNLVITEYHLLFMLIESENRKLNTENLYNKLI